MNGATLDRRAELEAAFVGSRERLVRILTQQLKCPQTAEDLVQDVFLAIPRARTNKPIHNPRAFIFRIASNLALNRAKQDARRRELREANISILWTAVEEITPERQLMAAEEVRRLGHAVDSLPQRTREILTWRRIDGLTNRQIAERLSISETAVEKHMRNAMTALISVMSNEHSG